MTDIDTAAIRAARFTSHQVPELCQVILDLCDALDAARANLELADSNAALADIALQTQTNYANTYQSLYARVVGERDAEEARAEAAEAALSNEKIVSSVMQERAEAADAELARVAEDYAGLIVRCKAAEAQCVLNSGEYAALERICGEFQDASREKSARIANALEFCEPEQLWRFCDDHDCRVGNNVRRALTEGTGQ